jgi:hypothetical protein
MELVYVYGGGEEGEKKNLRSVGIWKRGRSIQGEYMLAPE